MQVDETLDVTPATTRKVEHTHIYVEAPRNLKSARKKNPEDLT